MRDRRFPAEIEELALDSYYRRLRADKAIGRHRPYPSRNTTEVDTRTKRVVFHNCNGAITAFKYRDDGWRVVFREVELSRRERGH